jgi:hypothetical protein
MKNTKFIKSLLISLAITGSCLTVNFWLNGTVFAQGSLEEGLSGIQQQTQLPTFDIGAHPDATQAAGASNITSVIFFALDFVKMLIGGVAVIMILLIGLKLIIARKKIDDVWSKQKEHLIMIAAGFVILMIADFTVRKVFFGEAGEVLSSTQTAQTAAQQGSEQIRGIYNVGLLIAGTLAVLMLIFAGIRLLISGGNEEVTTKVKKQITWLVVGLFLLGVAEFVVQDFIFPKQGSTIPDVEKGQKMIVDFTNFASGFVVFTSIIFAIYAGYLYVIAVGNEEKTGKAKKALLGAAIAMVIAVGAFAIVNTLIQFKPGA